MTAKAESLSAQTFQTNGFYERLAQMRKNDPRTFNSLSPASKLALYHYEASKRQHEVEQAIKAEAA
jgi:hypothetical protein